MFIEKKRKFPYLEAIIGFVLFIFHYTSLIDVTVRTASPFILLPLCVAVSMYYGEFTGLIFGLVCGIFCDSVSSGTVCFNTLILMLLGFFIGILAKNIFNRNFPAALVLSLIACATYFLIKWCVFYLSGDVEGKVYYLLWFLAPSAFYTALFIIPFYYFEKWIHGELKKK
ncbi:MAG: rod shape-determining protein MreD [Acutalibacteraceae bacterium]|nr:rod shape-determining protein MreD [Acutalibacteraceae bacterium]